MVVLQVIARMNLGGTSKYILKLSKELEAIGIKSLIATGFPYTSGSNENDLNDVLKRIKDVLPLCQDLRRLGSASLDLCYVAMGAIDGYFEASLKEWDLAAGGLIATEAGAVVSGRAGGEPKGL